jgi:hypothetical protein
MRTFRSEVRRIAKRCARGEPLPDNVADGLLVWLYVRDRLRQRKRWEPATKGKS